MHSTATMNDKEAMMNRYYLTKMTARTDTEIIKECVFVTKDKNVARVSREY